MSIYSKGFMELKKVEKRVFTTFVTVYVVLCDGWYETEFIADSDSEAIEHFKKVIKR